MCQGRIYPSQLNENMPGPAAVTLRHTCTMGLTDTHDQFLNNKAGKADLSNTEGTTWG